MDAVLAATIKAYDEFTQQFQRFQSELKKTDRTQKDTAQGTEQMNRSFSGFMQTIGNLGALYAFQRALRETMTTGREFELTIKQAQAVTGDFSSTLRNLAMVSSGSKLDVFTPSQLAQAYRELGAAGATTNDIIGSTPDILEFGTAAIIDMNQSAEAVLATAKSFNIALTDSGTIVDAYTESMNRGALAGEDFKWIMGSVGAVAKMAGQDFREILSVGSAMRDSGIQAQDAGTSIKGALLQLINPTKEAQAVMKDLGINIYDSSGKMKQWSEITAEFEKGLAPLNEQSRNLVLATALGSDGIRAMATSMNKGSGYLREFTDGLKNSEGATNKMASAMADTFDGAIRRTNASLERAKVLLFEDFASASMGFLQTITTLLVGFNNVDEGTRKLIELFVGSMGLVAALGLIASTIKIAVIPALRAMGIAASASLGPWGLLIGVVTTLGGVLLGNKVASEGARVELEQHNKEIIAAGDNYLNLNDKLSTVNKNTDEYKALQGQANSALQELARQMPEVISQWDAEGNAIAVNNDLLREKIRLTKEAAQKSAEASLGEAQESYDKYYKSVSELSQRLNDLRSGQTIPYRDSSELHLGDAYLRERDIEATTKELEKAKEERDKALSDLNKSSAALGLTHTNWNDYSKDPSKFMDQMAANEDKDGGGGDKPYTPTPSGGTKNPAAEAAKKYIEAITDALHPYQSAAEAAANAVGGLGAKEQYLAQMMEAGLGDTNTAIELNKTRAAQLTQLTAQQDALKKQADAERLAMASLKEQYQAATDPETARELRDEIDNLDRSVAQLGQTWWQVEQQKLALTVSLKQEEKKRYDDAYQQAMDLMRHQVNMARMSTEQQIEYLSKLRNAYQWSDSQLQGMDEDLYRLRKQQLQAYLDSLEDEYQDKLDAIDARTEATTKAIQDQIDALEDEGTGSDRAEAVRKHNEKIRQLQEKRRDEELRTGIEHDRAIKDLDQQIAEENIEFQLQQEEWLREDKQDALQDQLDDAQEAGEEERKRLEDHYRRVIEIANQGALDTLAALAAKDPDWLETGKRWIQNLIDGIDAMEPEFQDRIDEAMDKMEDYEDQLPRTSTEPDLPSSGGGSSGSDDDEEDPSTMTWQQLLKYYKNHKMEAQQEINRAGYVYNQKLKAGDIEGAGAAHHWANQIKEAIGQSPTYDENTASSSYHGYEKGGPILQTGPIYAHEGEYMIPANLVDAIRRGTVPPEQPGAAAGGGGGVTIYITAPILAPENIHLYNNMDIEQVGEGLRKEIMALATAKG